MKPNANLFEINAAVLCRRLSLQEGREIRLADIPFSYWRSLAAQGFDAVWLMGVWQRGAAGRQRDRTDPEHLHEYDAAAPGWHEEDVFGSPYAVFSYTLDARLGEPGDLLTVQNAVHAAGLGLILDFVPNHLAPDHPWTREHPELFIQGTKDDLSRDPDVFFAVPGKDLILAHGKDPYFPSWKDTVQINYFSPAAREAMTRQLLAIARYADGVRCDMAMLVLSNVFVRTWGRFVGTAVPRREFWQEAIERVKRAYPGFTFIAEAYWDLEWELQQLGFDYTYDKRLYDRLLEGNVPAISGHLHADPSYQAHSLRFIENHDEPRAMAAFGRERSFAAAAIAATAPGLHLFHDGQNEGKGVHQPVQLIKEPAETPDPGAEALYRALLRFTHSTVLTGGSWRLLDASPAWYGNDSHQNLLVFLWSKDGYAAKLIAVNYASTPSQGRIRLSPGLSIGEHLTFSDALTGDRYVRSNGELMSPGMYIALGPWKSHLFDITYPPVISKEIPQEETHAVAV